MLGACLSRVQGLEEISLCFEKADPKVGIEALIDALDECLLNEDDQLLLSTSTRAAARPPSPPLPTTAVALLAPRTMAERPGVFILEDLRRRATGAQEGRRQGSPCRHHEEPRRHPRGRRGQCPAAA